jgi:hypothetical protein
MDTWKPLMTPIKIVLIFLVAGVFFIPTGTSIYKVSDRVSFEAFSRWITILHNLCPRSNFIELFSTIHKVFEQRVVYDGSDPNDVQCQIDVANQGRKCSVSNVLAMLNYAEYTDDFN